jgi:hypothetical protein
VKSLEVTKYSQYDLINKELQLLENKSFINRLFYSLLQERRYKFTLCVPNDIYSRAEILCDDILQMRYEDKVYSQGQLAEHIFLDFLDEVRNHDSNVGAIYTRLDVRKKQLPIIENAPLLPTRSNTTIITTILKNDVLRAEWLLKDLSYFKPKHGITVEHLIEIVYIDFLFEYTHGRRKNVLNEILECID